ncbi:PREDICTED: 21 kDa seed protein-like [Nelumbo nucifera]|uniref:21 kDa seed protein-like n=2 Tax=Nelumbo nucifera TaxID=4432 RepID=A0A822YSE1_NELNU|nr:PREDICTED: 21 kDa seed protein-like [Nelumbo nucifera]DAD35572.1 TPA_asm: hypothetical protein HUJ06_006212 [Nelumbo nucifera]
MPTEAKTITIPEPTLLTSDNLSISITMWRRYAIFMFLILASNFEVEAIAGSSSHHQSQVVLDTDGNQLEAGREYYIVSAIRGGGGGGVTIGKRESSSSHTPIVRQHSYDLNLGSPVTFTPASTSSKEMVIWEKFDGVQYLSEMPSEENRIEEQTDLNIGFSGSNRVWQVEDASSESSSSSSQTTRYVTLRGQPGHPGASTVRNWFRIERISRSNPEYQITYCPSVCESCHVECGNVGITKENGKRWLSVSQHREFPFVFVRVGETLQGSIESSEWIRS